MRALSSTQILHAIVEGCFNTKDRTLWRLDSLSGNLYLLIVSETVPNFTSLASQLCEPGEIGQTKEYDSFLTSIQNGQSLRFRLRGNTVYSVPMGKDKRGKVVPHVSEAHKKQWLVQKSEKHGFALNDFAITEMGQQRFYRNGKQKPVELSHATFEGTLTVTDAELFKSALVLGIGRAKSYGCGLMTVIKI